MSSVDTCQTFNILPRVEITKLVSFDAISGVRKAVLFFLQAIAVTVIIGRDATLIYSTTDLGGLLHQNCSRISVDLPRGLASLVVGASRVLKTATVTLLHRPLKLYASRQVQNLG